MTILKSFQFNQVPNRKPGYNSDLPDYYPDLNRDDKWTWRQGVSAAGRDCQVEAEPTLSFRELDSLRKQASILCESQLPPDFVEVSKQTLAYQGDLLPGQHLGIHFAPGGISLIVMD